MKVVGLVVLDIHHAGNTRTPALWSAEAKGLNDAFCSLSNLVQVGLEGDQLDQPVHSLICGDDHFLPQGEDRFMESSIGKVRPGLQKGLRVDDRG